MAVWAGSGRHEILGQETSSHTSIIRNKIMAARARPHLTAIDHRILCYIHCGAEKPTLARLHRPRAAGHHLGIWHNETSYDTTTARHGDWAASNRHKKIL